MIPNKTEVLNLKTRKTQVPMGYLSLNLIRYTPINYQKNIDIILPSH
jgi:hypothetical protein